MTTDPRTNQQIDELMVALEKASAGLNIKVVLIALSNTAAARIAATDPYGHQNKLDTLAKIMRERVTTLHKREQETGS